MLPSLGSLFLRPSADPTTERIHRLLEAIKKHAQNDSYVDVLMSIANWLHYYAFLVIIYSRYQEVNAASIRDWRRLLRIGKEQSTSSGPLPAGETAAFWQAQDLNAVLFLEIESFYLFGTILLDRIADTFAYYFGVRWDTRGGSTHRKLGGKFKRVCSQNKLTKQPSDLLARVHDLTKRVVDVRNKGFVHNPEPFSAGARSLNFGSNKAKIELGQLQKTTDELDKLLAEIQQYMIGMVEFFEANIERSVAGHPD